MRRTLIAIAMGVSMLPAAALASHHAVNVDLQVGGGRGWFDDSAWIQVRPDRGAYVAVYAVFSDGSIDLVFPNDSYESNWIDGCEPRYVQVFAPCGVYLDHVQAVASSRWFDPAECWVASDGGSGWAGPRVVVASAAPLVYWGYHVAWCAPRHTWNVVRSCSWNEGPQEWGSMPMLSAVRWKEPVSDGSGGRWKAAPSGLQEGQAEKQKWVVSGRNGVAHPNVVRSTAGGGEKTKSHPASGAKSSVTSRKTGEPERRSGR